MYTEQEEWQITFKYANIMIIVYYILIYNYYHIYILSIFSVIKIKIVVVVVVVIYAVSRFASTS